MSGSHGWSVELKMSASFEYSVQNCVSQVMIVKHGAPLIEWFVGGKDHGPAASVAFVDNVEEHVGGVVCVAEVADFVDDEDMGRGVGAQCLGHVSLAEGARELVDELGGGDEQGVKAVLDSAAGLR